MRMWLFALLLAACDDFATVQKKDSIEAYEAWLKDHADAGATAISANARLEELYRQRAMATKKADDYAVYVERYPKGKARPEMLKGLEAALFDAAENDGTEAAWTTFLERCKECDPRKRDLAKNGLEAAHYAANLEIGEVRVEPVNLANDPKGPMNGTGYFAEITNKGDKTLSLAWMNLVFSDSSGAPVGRFDAPLAAAQSTSRMPIKTHLRPPLKPGEKRAWSYTTDTVPEGAAGTPKLVLARVKAEE